MRMSDWSSDVCSSDLLDSDLSPAAYWEAAVRAKKRKELRRQANRLAEQGTVAFRRWRAGDALDPWLDAFLDLEARGWKGQAGSALASHGEPEIGRASCGERVCQDV